MTLVTSRDIASATGLNVRSVQRKLQDLEPCENRGNTLLYSLGDILKVFSPSKDDSEINYKLKEAQLQYINEKVIDQRLKNDIALDKFHDIEECLAMRNQVYANMKNILERMPYRIAAIPATQKNIRLKEAKSIVLEVLTELNKVVY